MCFLSHKQICERAQEIFPKGDFNEKRLRGAAYDLTLGPEYFVSPGPNPGRLTEKNDILIIPHGEFALLQTNEYISIPDDLLGLITMRFSLKVKGLINVSGFHVDPGFRGKIVYAVFNAGPTDIQLRYKEPTFTIFFSSLLQKVDKEYRYGGERCQSRYQELTNLPIDVISALRGSSLSLTTVDKRVLALETQVKIYGGILAALLLAVIGWVATKL
jgi:dCTP deaminase